MDTPAQTAHLKSMLSGLDRVGVDADADAAFATGLAAGRACAFVTGLGGGAPTRVRAVFPELRRETPRLGACTLGTATRARAAVVAVGGATTVCSSAAGADATPAADGVGAAGDVGARGSATAAGAAGASSVIAATVGTGGASSAGRICGSLGREGASIAGGEAAGKATLAGRAAGTAPPELDSLGGRIALSAATPNTPPTMSAVAPTSQRRRRPPARWVPVATCSPQAVLVLLGERSPAVAMNAGRAPAGGGGAGAVGAVAAPPSWIGSPRPP